MIPALTNRRWFLPWLVLLTGVHTPCTVLEGSKALPNILLIVADDLGTQIGVYGDSTIATPNIDRLTEEGTRFVYAYVTSASCSPSRSSILTGLYPHQSGQLGLNAYPWPVDPQTPNLPSLLKNAGYRTLSVGKLDAHPALDLNLDTRIATRPTSDGRDPDILARHFDEFVKKDPSRPFFAMIGSYDPHRPYNNRKINGYPAELVRGEQVKVFEWLGIEQQNIREEIAAYYTCVSRFDLALGRVMQVLVENQCTNNTLVVFMGDHGPDFTRAKMSNYEAGLQVPLIVCWPRQVVRGQARRELVSSVDIMPTLLEAAGVDVPRNLTGRSLWPLLKGNEPSDWRSSICAEFNAHRDVHFYPIRSIRNSRFKLIANLRAGSTNPIPGFYAKADSYLAWQAARRADAAETPGKRAIDRHRNPPAIELYDLQNDPHELHNLANERRNAAVKVSLMDQLNAWRRQTEDPYLDPDKLREDAERYLGASQETKPN